jgi:hypothetical protein
MIDGVISLLGSISAEKNGGANLKEAIRVSYDGICVAGISEKCVSVGKYVNHITGSSKTNIRPMQNEEVPDSDPRKAIDLQLEYMPKTKIPSNEKHKRYDPPGTGITCTSLTEYLATSAIHHDVVRHSSAIKCCFANPEQRLIHLWCHLS